MKRIFTKDWFVAAFVRAIKTFAQTFCAMIVVGQAMADINWTAIASVALVAMILSLGTSIAGLPEVSTDGTMKVNTSDPNKDVFSLELDTAPELIANQNMLRLKVEPTEVPPPSQE